MHTILDQLVAHVSLHQLLDVATTRFPRSPLSFRRSTSSTPAASLVSPREAAYTSQLNPNTWMENDASYPAPRLTLLG